MRGCRGTIWGWGGWGRGRKNRGRVDYCGLILFFPLSKQRKGEGDKGSEGDESRRGKGAIGEGWARKP